MKHLRLILILIIVSLESTLAGQLPTSDTKSWTLGPELQLYPTGLLPGIRVERYLNDKGSIHLRLGLQLFDHRDLGVQDDETGIGYGFSLAYRRFFKSHETGFSLALRNDFWWNKVDWTNKSPAASGTTSITVIQPTAILEYKIPTTSSISIAPSLGMGFEWNAKTQGEPTGEGAIILLGVFVGF